MIIVCVDFKGACFSKRELAAVWLRFICVDKSSNRAFRPYQSNMTMTSALNEYLSTVLHSETLMKDHQKRRPPFR